MTHLWWTDTGTIDDIRQASPADVLRWQGWEDCPTCEGTGWADKGWLVEQVRAAKTGKRVAVAGAACPDCAHGLVPPDWMVREAVIAFVDCLEGADSYSVGEFISMQRALVAAARKAPQ